MVKTRLLNKNLMNAPLVTGICRFRGRGEDGRYKSYKEVLSIVIAVVGEMLLKRALTQIPGIAFLVGIVGNIAGPRMEAWIWKLKLASLHSHFLSYLFAFRHIFYFALPMSSSSS